MAVLDFPASLRNPASVQIGLAGNTQSGGRSPFDGTEQTLELPGARWVAELRFVNLRPAEWRVLSAFVADLGGRAGRFRWGPSKWAPRQGTRGGAPTISSSSGKILVSTGWATGAGPLALGVGDWIGFVDGSGRDVLHLVTEAVFTDGAGNAGVLIAPAVRRPPPAGTSLNISTPRAIWRLAQDQNPLEFTSGPPRAAATLQIEEAIF